VIYQLKTAIFMVGGTRVEDLWRSGLTIWGRLNEELEIRGIDVERYILTSRLEPLLWRNKLAV